jgi:hypothetical protein
MKDKLQVLIWNSPYTPRETENALTDIKTAIFEQKIINVKKLKRGKPYNFNFECMFIPNSDGKTYTQGFKFLKLEEST